MAKRWQIEQNCIDRYSEVVARLFIGGLFFALQSWEPEIAPSKYEQMVLRNIRRSQVGFFVGSLFVLLPLP